MPETIEVPLEIRGNEAAVIAPQDADRALQVAQAYVIDDDEMFAAAGDELRGIVTKGRQIEELRKSLTGPILEAKRRIDEFFRGPLDRLSQAESVLKLSMSTYQREQQRRIEEAQRAAAAEAERQRQEAERIAAEQRAAEAAAQAERERLAAEATTRMEQAVKTGDATAMAEAEQLAAEAQAIQAAPVESRPQEEIHVPAVVVPIAAKAKGVSFRNVWKAEVTDHSAFIRGAAGRPEIEAMLKVDESALNKFAQATAGKAHVAGVRFYEDTVTAARRR